MRLKISKFKIGAIIISSLFVGFFALGALFFRDSTFEKLAIITEVIQLVKNNYVDKVDLPKLFQGAFNGLMESLDSESAYLTKKEYEYFKLNAPNRYGITLAQRTPQSPIIIARAAPGSSAYEEGIKAGSMIASINNQNVAELSLFQARYLLATEEKMLNISLMEEDYGKEISVDLKPGKAIREKVEVKIIAGDIVYMSIPNLLGGTSKQVRKSIAYLNDKGVEILILDLRDNCQGLISEAIMISDYFLAKGLILRLKSRKEKEKLYKAEREKSLYDSFFAVLINSQTMGSAEILTASFKDNNRAKILGERTFGLGLEYDFIPLSKGAAIRIPRASCFTPNNEPIHNNGITPDITIKTMKKPLSLLQKEEKQIDIDHQLNNALKQIKELYKDWKKQHI